jgi:cytochrome c5
LPDGKGKDTTKRVCSGCHSTNTFASLGYTREKWSSTLDSMTAKGMDASDDEISEILDYLAAHFPPPPDKSAPAVPGNPPAPK